MTEQERNPCGTAHPLPCGLDVACPESDYVPADALEELVAEWEEVASWGERDEMSRYEKGLKDDGKDKANELRELVEEHTNE